MSAAQRSVSTRRWRSRQARASPRP